MSELLAFDGVNKTYGKQQVLDSISFGLEPGKITALLGPNGSGKTTMLRIAAGVLGYDAGNVDVCGGRPEQGKDKVAYLRDGNFLLWWMKPKQARAYFADFYPDFDAEYCDRLLEFMDVPLDKSLRQMSKGMAEKFHLALILARRAKLILLDEPLGGVDLIARDDILKAIVRRFDEESAILVSTHLVGDIERYVDDAMFLQNGRIIAKVNAEQIREEQGKSLTDVYRQFMGKGKEALLDE